MAAFAQPNGTFLDFGSNFMFGQVMNAYQHEGSLLADGAGPSNVQTWCEWNLGQPVDVWTCGAWTMCGDVGAGFYTHMEEDVALMASLGQKHLHFQVSWVRLFPDGVTVNEAGVAFYNRLIDALLSHGITPWVSIEVLDHPQVFTSTFGGWLGAPIVPAYRRLADTVFARFGDRVTHFFSFHEPTSLCASFPEGGRFVGPRPNVNDSSVQGPRDQYLCMYRMLQAHAQAVESLAASANPNASLSIISDASWQLPNSSSPEDAAAVDRYMIWHLAAWFDPVVTGDWPPEMRALDPTGDRLPFFTPAEQAALRGSATYLGVNHYSTTFVSSAGFPCALTGSLNYFETDLCVRAFCDGRCGRNPNPLLNWLHYYPEGMRSVLRWMSNRYPHTPLLVAESGVGLDGGSLGDPASSGDIVVDVADAAAKVGYLTAYWAQAHAAMTTDGVDLRGIFHWSFLDNLEWNTGYAAHFGMVHVDHTRPDLRRTPKESAYWYKDVIAKHGFYTNVTTP